MKIRHLPRYLRLQAFDTRTEQGRADERYRRTLLSVTANVFSKGLAMLVVIFSIKWTLPYLGAERFGIWTTIASFTGMLSLLDLGIGNALVNRIAGTAASGNEQTLQSTISGGLGVAGLLGMLIALTLFIAACALPWPDIIATQSPLLQEEISTSTRLFAALFGMSLFTNSLQRIFAGLQSAYVGHLSNIAGTLASLICIYWSARLQLGITSLLMATFGIQTLTGLILLLPLRQRGLFRLKSILPSLREEYRSLIHAGGLFFVLQIGTMITWGADSFIIANLLGASQVAIYSLTQRLFSFISQPINIINAPLWAAFADANSHHDHNFIQKTLKKSLLLTLCLFMTGSAVILLTHQTIIEHWSSGTIEVSTPLVRVFSLWSMLDVMANAFAMYMNGCQIIKPQVLGLLTLIILGLPLKLYLISHYGLTTMIAGFSAFFLLNLSLWYGVIFRKDIAKPLCQGE